MNVEELVCERVLAIVRLRRPEERYVASDQELRGDLELDSLDLAQLGAEIETALGMTIFEDVAVGAILTVGDLVEVCAQRLAEAKRAS